MAPGEKTLDTENNLFKSNIKIKVNNIIIITGFENYNNICIFIAKILIKPVEKYIHLTTIFKRSLFITV
jgi:hypothetical protein